MRRAVTVGIAASLSTWMFANAVGCNDSAGGGATGQNDGSSHDSSNDMSVQPDIATGHPADGAMGAVGDATVDISDMVDGADSALTTSDRDGDADASLSDGTGTESGEMDAAVADQPISPPPDSPVQDGAAGDAPDTKTLDAQDVESGALDGPPVDVSGGDVDAGLRPTELALNNRSPACLACAQQLGCLDPAALNLSCDQFTGTAVNGCIDILTCALGAGCGVTTTNPSCLCGSVDASVCSTDAGTPTGVCKDSYVSGFGRLDVSAILASFNDPTNPAGDANLLVQCLQSMPCSACFPHD